MSDDDWTRALQEAAQDLRPGQPCEGDVDERWERWCRGELSKDETAGLEPRRSARAYAAFKPFGRRSKRRMAHRLMRQVTGSPKDASPVASAGPSRWGAWLGVGAFVPAAAAALWLAMVPPAQEPLPPYRIEIARGDQALRGPETLPQRAAVSSVPRLSPGSRFEITLRPATAIDGSVTAKAWIEQEGIARRVGLEQQVTDQGTLRLHGVVGQGLPAAPGLRTFWVAVARPGTDLDADALGLAGRAAGSYAVDDAQLFVLALDIRPSP